MLKKHIFQLYLKDGSRLVDHNFVTFNDTHPQNAFLRGGRQGTSWSELLGQEFLKAGNRLVDHNFVTYNVTHPQNAFLRGGRRGTSWSELPVQEFLGHVGDSESGLGVSGPPRTFPNEKKGGDVAPLKNIFYNKLVGGIKIGIAQNSSKNKYLFLSINIFTLRIIFIALRSKLLRINMFS